MGWSGGRRARGLLALPLALTLTSGTLLGLAQPAHAGGEQHGLDQVVLNPGGGEDADGLDGIRVVLNENADANGDWGTDGSDQVWFAGTAQYCCGGVGPHLSVGGMLFGESAAAYWDEDTDNPWTSIALVGTTGAASSGNVLPATTGSASAHLRYTAEKGGQTYTIDRTVSYTFPNDYYRDTYTFTIPAGNTDVVKFYKGGDTSPGSSDQGYGIQLTSPVRSVISLNPSSGIQVGQREVAGSKPFDGATTNRYSAPYDTVIAGGDLGFVTDTDSHDAGFMTQWNLGSTPGTQTYAQETFVNFQGTSLTAGFRSAEVAPGTPVLLDLNLVNTRLSEATGVGYTFTLPEGLSVATGAPVNGCGGTLTASGRTITLAGGTVPQAANCVVSVPVVGGGGSYSIGGSAVSGLAVATNGVGTSTLTVTGPAAPTAPGAPGGVTAVAQSSAVLVSWTAPTTGAPAAKYRVTASPGSATCETTGLSCVLGGVAGTTYTFTVTPLTAGGLAGTPATVTTSVAVAAPVIPSTAPETPLKLTTDKGLITVAAPGERITVIGSGFLPFSTVSIVIHSTPTVLGQVITDANGAFSEAVVVPPGLAAGAHSLVAYGVDPAGNPHLLRMDVTVAAATTAQARLANTGLDMAPLTYVAFAAGLLVIGFALVASSRARRRQS